MKRDRMTPALFARALLLFAPLLIGCAGDTDPCAAPEAKSDACLTVKVTGSASGLSGANFVFSGATAATKLVDLAGNKVTKPPFTVGFRLGAIGMAGDLTVLCVAATADGPVASGSATAAVSPGTHTKVDLTLTAVAGDMDFGDLTPTESPDLTPEEDMATSEARRRAPPASR